MVCSVICTIVSGIDIWSILLMMLVTIIFLATWAFNRLVLLRLRKKAANSQDISAIMQHTLEIGHGYVVRLNVAAQQAYNLHGDLLPPEGMNYQESFKCIPPEDHDTYRNFIFRLFHRETEIDECIFRWDTSGKQHLGNWRYMKAKGIVEFDNKQKNQAVNILCTLTDETDHIRQMNVEQELNEKYQRVFELSIVGLAFYDSEGNLLAVNQKMREILKFQSEHDSYYYSHSLYDMPTIRDLLTDRRPEDLYFCTKSVVVERGVNCYTEQRLHPIYDNGQLLYITFSIRDVTQERELYLLNRKNDQKIRRANEEIQQYETEIQYLMENCDMRFWRATFKERKIVFYKGLSKPEKELTFDEFLSYFVDDNNDIVQKSLSEPEKYFTKPEAYMRHMRAIYHESSDLHWNIIDTVPYFNEQGRIVGCYGVIRNVTDLVKKQELLKQETERANDSGRLKSVFMANMTHEIRTPLNSIVGFSDVLPMMTTPEEKKEIVRVIMNNCDMLLRLINDILAISSLDAGGIHIEKERVDFAKSFDDICESLRERVQQPGVEFRTDNPYRHFETVVDNGRIQQVITNFVTNAVKYTHQGHIKVGYGYDNHQLRVYCEDTGEGIPKEAQGKIFDRFVKLNDYIQGTGLGLSICKAIADGCKGEIGVTSEGKDKGSTFWMTVPCEELESERREK